MQEMLDRKDTVKEMRKTYDNWIDGLESKGLLSLNQQVNDVVGSMSSPETASLQDIFKTMATKVQYSYSEYSTCKLSMLYESGLATSRWSLVVPYLSSIIL